MPADRTDPTPVETCSLGRALDIVGERWTFWVLREALAGTTRFADFRTRLGIASDVLAARLAKLVDAGVLERRSYKEPGQRARESYHLTDPGRQLIVVLGALQQWGDEHVPTDEGPSTLYRTAEGRPVTVQFLDADGTPLTVDDVHLERSGLRELH